MKTIGSCNFLMIHEHLDFHNYPCIDYCTCIASDFNKHLCYVDTIKFRIPFTVGKYSVFILRDTAKLG